MSELAPGFALEGDGVAWPRAVAAGCRPRLRHLPIPRRAVCPLAGGCFARRITVVNRRRHAPKSEKPRKIRHLRRSAARAPRPRSDTTGGDWGRATATSGILALRDLTMASFNTVAGCVLASALFAMVVGKVSNALVHPHKLDKPALAVSDEAPTRGRRGSARAGAAADRTQARRRQCRGGQGDLPEAVLHLPHRRQGRRQQGRPQPVGRRRPQEGEPRGLQPTPRPCRPRAAIGPTKTSTTWSSSRRLT